jgi:HEAT repeat protein
MRVHGWLATAAAALVLTAEAPAGADGAAAPDVAALLAAARGAPPVLCALAARAVGDFGNSGWGRGADAPAPPLGAPLAAGADDEDQRGGLARLSAAEAAPLLDAVGDDDPCVRELAVRVLGRQREPATRDAVAAALASRLAAPAAPMRAAAAFGLGLAGPPAAVPPLVRALGDQTADVRANAAWALGRIEDGRALAPLTARAGDADARVREA